MGDVGIRLADEADLPAIVGIYNHYVRETPVTFDMTPYTPETRMPWFSQFGPVGRYRLIVATDEGSVIGYAGTTRHRPKAAYDTSVETTIYMAPGQGGRGLGTRLYEALFEAVRDEDIHMALGGVTVPNDASVRLHEKAGFHHLGTFTEAGRKFGRFWDVAWFEKRIGKA